jgi:hypothetical protein
MSECLKLCIEISAPYGERDLMDIESLYQKTISSLEQGSRALIRFSPQEIEELTQSFQAALLVNDLPSLEKILCLIDHNAVDYAPWETPILEALNKDLPPRLMVFALNCARKHIIQARFKRGTRLQFDFLETLKKLLFSPSPEVVEWTLRTIEECGNQGVFFLRDFDKIKPPPWKWFNQHQRSVREIIAMLERRWSRFEKL